MSELSRALSEIQSIRAQVAHSTEFRGYGPVTLSVTAVAALVAGALQAWWVPNAAAQPGMYVALWLSTAVICGALIATEMILRAQRLHTGMADEMVRTAVLQFLPAGVAGAVMPFVLLHTGAAALWMLPGLWQVIFSLGVFACRRGLPRAMVWVGVFFLLSGMALLWMGDDRALGAGTMAVPFALGMALVAVIHQRSGQRGVEVDDEA